MALTIEEQLNVLNGIVTPSGSTYNINEITEQVAVNFAQNFLTNAKDVSVSAATQNAVSYRNKIINTCSVITRGRQNFQIISKIIIAIYADTGDYSNVTNAGIGAWSTFVENNILEAIEIASIVLPEEKTDYDTL